MPFFGVALASGERVSLKDCALTHASLVDPSAGACSVYLGDRLLVRLHPSNPQVPICAPIGTQSMLLQCNGKAGGAGVHLLGRRTASSSPPVPEPAPFLATAPVRREDAFKHTPLKKNSKNLY